jgi:hypothetical protein
MKNSLLVRVALLGVGLGFCFGGQVLNKVGQTVIAKAPSAQPRAMSGEAPIIVTARLKGRRLLVTGDNFDNGAVILVDGVTQGTINDFASPATTLISTKAGKRIELGRIVKLQVQNSEGQLSDELPFYTGCGQS